MYLSVQVYKNVTILHFDLCIPENGLKADTFLSIF